MTWNGFGDMAIGHCNIPSSNIPTQGVDSTCNPMFECFEWFSSKRGAFHFTPIDLLMEGRKTDLTLGHVYQNFEIYIL